MESQSSPASAEATAAAFTRADPDNIEVQVPLATASPTTTPTTTSTTTTTTTSSSSNDNLSSSPIIPCDTNSRQPVIMAEPEGHDHITPISADTESAIATEPFTDDAATVSSNTNTTSSSSWMRYPAILSESSCSSSSSFCALNAASNDDVIDEREPSSILRIPSWTSTSTSTSTSRKAGHECIPSRTEMSDLQRMEHVVLTKQGILTGAYGSLLQNLVDYNTGCNNNTSSSSSSSSSSSRSDSNQQQQLHDDASHCNYQNSNVYVRPRLGQPKQQQGTSASTTSPLPVVQEQYILNQESLQPQQPQSQPQGPTTTNSTTTTTTTATATPRGTRIIQVRPGAYHQAPGQVAIRRNRSCANVFQQQHHHHHQQQQQYQYQQQQQGSTNASGRAGSLFSSNNGSSTRTNDDDETINDSEDVTSMSTAASFHHRHHVSNINNNNNNNDDDDDDDDDDNDDEYFGSDATNRTFLSDDSVSLGGAISISSFSMQGYHEQQDHLPPDVMILMNNNNNNNDNNDNTHPSSFAAAAGAAAAAAASTSNASYNTSLSQRRRRQCTSCSSRSISSEDYYERQLYDEESIGTFSMSVASLQHPALLSVMEDRSSLVVPRDGPATTAEHSTTRTSNYDGLVQAHPVVQQDERNIVAADPVDASGELSQPGSPRQLSLEADNEHSKIRFIVSNSKALLWTLSVCVAFATGAAISIGVVLSTGSINGVEEHGNTTSLPSLHHLERARRIQQRLEKELGKDLFIADGGDGVSDTVTRAFDITSVHSKVDIGGNVIDIGTDPSACRKALDWLVHEDGLTLNDTSENLVQRFLLGYFYYHTSEETDWVSCNPLKGLETEFCSYYYARPFGEGYDESPWHIRWLSSEHECDWAGVYCTESQVDKLSLNGYNLSGTFPTRISKLHSLTTLSLRDNHFRGVLPSELVELNSLTVLRLNRNMFTGAVPPEWGDISELKFLDIGGNLLTGTLVTTLGRLTNLENFWIESNGFSGQLTIGVSPTANLKQVLMSNNDFVGTIPRGVGSLTNLEFLDLSMNSKITGKLPSEIGRLSNLRDLVLSSTSLTGAMPEELYHLDVLQDLKLDDCNFTGTISSKIAKMSGLQNLVLAGNSFSGVLPSDLGTLKSLIQVQLQGNNFNGTVPEAMCLLKGPNTLKKLVADCASSSVAGKPPLVCPADCCTSCCDVITQICF